MEDKLRKVLEKLPLKLEVWEIPSLQQIVKEQQQEIERLKNGIEEVENIITGQNVTELIESIAYAVLRAKGQMD